MKLCIAEKPSVAKEIAEILGAKTRKQGYFEGNGYWVSWTFGHLCTLNEPRDYQPSWGKWSLYSLPILPNQFGIKVMDDQGVKNQFKVIYNLVAKADEIINCGDAGQEGELIQRWVLAKAKNKKPVKRLWISSLTEEAIREGFKNLKDGSDFDNLYSAGSSRAVGDWLLGINATRLYTLKYAKEKQVLSIGRVQTPTLALLVNRQLEIENFKPESYWEVKTVYRDTLFSCTESRFKVKEKAQEIANKIKESLLTIEDTTVKKGKEKPPSLFDLTSLQVECNKKFGYSADETLKTVQRLYENKFVTYPRVDTTYLSDDIYPKIAGILKGLTDYQKLTTPLLAEKIKKQKKVFNNNKVTDHHAIIPTGVKAFVSGMDAEVYHLITKTFIAAFYPDCEVSNTTVMAKVADIDFKATGKQILFEGWRKVWGLDVGPGEAPVMPNFEKGESGPHEPDLQEKQTQPPKYYSEATLLRAMETAGKNVDDEELREAMKENGIGRPSTRANIIETLFRRKYIQKEKKRLIATNVGIELIETIQNDLLKSAELTGQWEHKLKEIERGEYSGGQFVHEMKKMVEELVDEVMLSKPVRRIGLQEQKATPKKKKDSNLKDLSCPKCKNGKLLKGKAAYGCSEWKNDCKFKVDFEIFGKKISDKQFSDLIKNKKTGLIKGFILEEKKIDGKLIFKDDYSIGFEAAEKQEMKCPKCQNGSILKGKSAFGCSSWKEGCRFMIPFEMKGKKLTQKQIEDLIKKGKTSTIKGFKSDNEESISGVLSLNAENQLIFSQK